MQQTNPGFQKKLNWYGSWHQHPRHQHAHWLFFFATLLLVSSFLSGEIGKFYLENEYQAKAQGNLTLGKSGDKFTVNGSQKFLLMISYFDAMEASDATLESDFSQLQSLGFSGIRILPNWPFGNGSQILMDSNGNLQSGMLNRLVNIVQRAQNHNLIVDITFNRETVSGLSVGGYRNGIVSTAQGLIAYRNLYFDLANEADHDGTTCGTARLCPSEARQVRDAVKAVDSQRIVSISLNSGSIDTNYTINGGMDFNLVHGPFSTFNGTRSLVTQAKSATPGIPIHMQEPDRCRGNPCAYSANQFITAASDAKCAGATGWNFHNNAGYNLSGGAMFSRWIDPNVENAVAAGIYNTISGVGWGSCTSGSPTPTPIPTSSGTPLPTLSTLIYYVNPSSALAGETIIIGGQSLSATVSFYNSSGTSIQSTGTLNSGASEVTIAIPSTLSPGLYTVGIGSSNKVGLEILASGPLPTPGTTSTSIAIPCDASTIQIATQNNLSIICDIAPNLANPGDAITMSGVTLGATIYMTPATGGIATAINGNLNTNGDLLTFLIPANIAPGDYGLRNLGANGNASTSEIISIQIPGQPISQANPQLPALPPASNFQDLISNAFNYSLILVGIAVFIMIMWGGFLWLTSAANPGNIATAKRYILNAILGAVLLVSAYVILRTINPELVGGSLKLLGIQVPSSAQATGITRLVAINELQAASAINAGCTISVDTRYFTAVECDSATADALSLPLDPALTTADTNTNNQIGATTFQNNGNLGAGRKIVVLDTGYNYNNPDLSSSYLGGRDFFNNDSDPMDDNTSGGSAPGHGSHVAGIITGDGIDSRARGVAPQAGIIAGKILDSSGNGNWSNLTDAIYWAANGPDGIHGTSDDFNADAINISVGGGSYTTFCDNADATTQVLATALKYARDNGVLPIIAAGNSSTGVMMPGCIDASFTVGAVDSSDRIANFSGRGISVDIVAPGVNIYSTLLGTNYGLKSGTSMATPVVSGAAALLKGTNPGYTANQLEQALTSSACDLGATGKDTTFGWGRVSLAPGNCTPPPAQPSSGPAGTVTASPTSCTKGISATNPNCNTTIFYTITGITSATQLTVGKDGNFFQNIQCGSSPCSGQLTDNNPAAGIHGYDFRIVNNVIAKGSSYIFTTGNISANFGSCTQGSNLTNPTCNVTLNITAPGVSPNSIVVIKDGYNWRLVPCSNVSCSASLIDNDPTVGTHTYAIQDSSDNTNSRLGRVTIVISPPATSSPICNTSPGETMELCTGTNYTGTCSQFNCQEKNNFTGSSINGQTIMSARIIRTTNGVSDARLYTCDTGWVHPNPSATEPTPCLWLDFDTTTQVPDIWNGTNNKWCYWTWVSSTATTFCGQPTPTGSGINIKSYGSL